MSGGGQKGESKPTAQTTQAQQTQYDASKDILQKFASQMMEMLSTGKGTQIPIAQRATEAGANAAATTNANTKEALARGGVTGPYARQVQAGTEEKGAFDVSQIDPQIVQAILQMVPDFALMRGSPVWGGQVSKNSGWNFGI